MLLLHAGTGSVGSAFVTHGWNVLGLDIEPGRAICCEIMQWDYTVYPCGYFDCIHASPPCTHYSKARTTAKTPRDLVGADRLVQRTLDIINYFKPTVFIIENPATGLMKDRPVMSEMRKYMHVVTYCRYGLPYKKPTAIWTNCEWNPRPACCKADPCENVQDNKHGTRAQIRQGWTTRELYVIPKALCEELARCVTATCYRRVVMDNVVHALRTTVIPLDGRKRVTNAYPKRGVVIGLVFDFAAATLVPSRVTRQKPILARMVCDLARRLFPEFPFTSAMINVGGSKLHIDKNNRGPSMILSLGAHRWRAMAIPWRHP